MKYLVLPMQPTPNGRMHIGHGGGTYLRADVITRSLRLAGHEVEMVCGSDAYENWVLAALSPGENPLDLCNRYDAEIQADLRALGVHFDQWINPLDAAHNEDYCILHQDVFTELRATGGARQEFENIPYRPADGSPLIGTFIAGECPACGAQAGGSSCTDCGQHFQPEDLRNARARLTQEVVRWRRQASWFLRPTSPSGLLEELEARRTADSCVPTVRRYLKDSGGRIRLSGPGRWGITSPLLASDDVLSNSYYLYCLYAAKRSTLGASSPFDISSSVRTVGVFGSDNTVPGLVAPVVFAQALSRLKPFDVTVVNGMLDLDGRKCSTSKGHGIWLKDILTSGLVTADELRIALAMLPLDRQRANTDFTSLAETIDAFRHLFYDRVVPALQGHVTGSHHQFDRSAVEGMRRSLLPHHVDLPGAARTLLAYLARGGDVPERNQAVAATETGVWLATVAMLAGAITPSLSELIWNYTGSRPEGVGMRPFQQGGDLTSVALRATLSPLELAALSPTSAP